jgi:hypothetical protein
LSHVRQSFAGVGHSRILHPGNGLSWLSLVGELGQGDVSLFYKSASRL